MTNTPLNFGPDRALPHLSVLDLVEDDIDHTGLDAIDPDLNFIPQICSKYYNLNDLNSVLFDHIELTLGFSVLNHNIRSAVSNISDLENYLESIKLDFKFSVVGLTETWLTDENSTLYSMHNYRATHLTRKNRRGGGVSFLVHKSLTFKHRNDLSKLTPNIECLFIEVDRTHSTPSSSLLMAVIYRPPNSDFISFMHVLTQILHTTKNENKECYIMGDFNLDILGTSTDLNALNFLDLMHSSSFIPLINAPTRITSHSATLIDNIFHNKTSSEHLSGILYTDISDHLPTFSIDPILRSPPVTTKKVITTRSFAERNKQDFTGKLSRERWAHLFSCDQANEAYTSFIQTFTNIYNTSFPYITKMINPKRNKPWLSFGLKKSIKQKNKLYITFRKRPTVQNEIKYKSFKRILTKLIKKTEKEYYHSLLLKHKHNPRLTWKTLKNLINRHREDQALPQLIHDEHRITEPPDIVDHFNKYFTEIGPNLASTIPSTARSPESFLQGNYPQSCFFTPATETEVKNGILLLKNGSPGHDDINPQVVRNNAELIKGPLTHVINLSLAQGIIPQDLKIANITPIHKGGATHDVNNYRPISVLPTFSKILERIAYNKMLQFINSHNTISRNQFGFRKGHSCEMPLILATDQIREALDQHDDVLGIFLDMRKAFDTVDAKILLRKMEHYGFRGICLKWIESYLTHRMQIVKHHITRSTPRLVQCGVPQGSILGPLLFLLFINDLCDLDSAFSPFVFADDTTLFLRGNNLDEMAQTANTELERISTWLKTNKLSINLKKTHYMHFTLHTSKRNTPMNIKIDGHPIHSCEFTKFLGLTIDNRMNWSHHINSIANKISRNIGVLKKVKGLLPRKSLIQIYNSLILPYLNYCHVIWAKAPRVHFERLVVLQKKAMRLICNVAPYSSTQDLFQQCGVMQLNDLYTYVSGILMFKYCNNLLPATFSSRFVLVPHILSNTRNAQKALFQFPKCRTTTMINSVRAQLCKLHNEFLSPLDIHVSSSLYTCKKALKSILS